MEAETLQRIAAAVTPAVMVSACGLIALGLDNQAGRMTTRMRDMTREFRAQTEAGRRERLRRQANVIAQRHRHLTVALVFNYAAILCFVTTSLVYLAGPVIGLFPVLPVATFVLGVLLLAGVAVAALLNLRLSRVAIQLELHELEAP